jgi:hypothetical protein
LDDFPGRLEVLFIRKYHRRQRKFKEFPEVRHGHTFERKMETGTRAKR